MNIERGVGGRGRKRDREEQISGERERGLESYGKGIGCKIDHWDSTPEYFNKRIKYNINQLGY